jgi:hypothetical protein
MISDTNINQVMGKNMRVFLEHVVNKGILIEAEGSLFQPYILPPSKTPFCT